MADSKTISQHISRIGFYTLSAPLLGIICWSCSSNTPTESPKPETQTETTSAEKKPEKTADI
ncbi:MAG: hypothetical protein KDA74_08805, partial [Planctomycetaceae bacterium]|nr:hypothetical protein [Planctomycetaceae bacterium]